jgi:hypothetical protein
MGSYVLFKNSIFIAKISDFTRYTNSNMVRVGISGHNITRVINIE